MSSCEAPSPNDEIENMAVSELETVKSGSEVIREILDTVITYQTTIRELRSSCSLFLIGRVEPDCVPAQTHFNDIVNKLDPAGLSDHFQNLRRLVQSYCIGVLLEACSQELKSLQEVVGKAEALIKVATEDLTDDKLATAYTIDPLQIIGVLSHQVNVQRDFALQSRENIQKVVNSVGKLLEREGLLELDLPTTEELEAICEEAFDRNCLSLQGFDFKMERVRKGLLGHCFQPFLVAFRRLEGWLVDFSDRNTAYFSAANENMSAVAMENLSPNCLGMNVLDPRASQADIASE